MKYLLNWQLGFSSSKQEKPNELFPAAVPGAVQLDYAVAHGMPDHNYELNYRDYGWMQEKYWLYKAEFDATDHKTGNLFFVCKGIDYKYDIFVNGNICLSYEGMYRETVLDLTEFSGKKISIEILIYPAPVSNLENVKPGTRDEANQTCKAAVSYGWDFHPRLIPLGICDEAYILHSSHSAPIKPVASYDLNEDLTAATVKLSVNTSERTEWKLTAPNGETVFEGNNREEVFIVEAPELWWCNGYGEPNLYTYELTVYSFNEPEIYSGKIGFKTVTLEMNEGTWDVPEFPKTRSCPPITICLNGVKVFAKGTNWVAPEIFYGTITDKRYYEQLELIRSANMNIVRCWGGAPVGKDAFFEICDKLGIMVWQEFPLACNDYKSTKPYLELLKAEATDIIDRVKCHPSLTVWCGGNELFNAWSGMTDQSLAIRTLNSLTLEKTPEIPFLPTSPLMGMAHGSYLFIYFDGREVIDVMQNSHNTAYTEFGVPSISSIETLNMIASENKLFPLENTEITRSHHAFKAWCADDSWCLVNTIERYFGKSSSLSQLIERGQYLQGVGYRFIFEEARRQKPHCSMAINWCFNEPWACLANNSIVSYPNNIKNSYYDVARACRSVAATARYRKLKYKGGEVLDFDLYMLNDGLKAVKCNTVEVLVQVGENAPEHIINWDVPNLRPNISFEGPTIRYALPNIENAKTLKIILSAGEYSSEYTLLYESVEQKKAEKVLNI